ncbi:2-keto-3-deoxy-L-rhamnonate aldolase [Sulfitobacter sp. DSM 110093]|uniref:HpcH/HpaI aldolase family protein n=1 Tax=Sulfitobacter sp. DSM 110093 TaxID=2883127 RepID=UPI001FAC1F20|nr:aldolase/citrate lyase family protein [Sulfitobacter sp. DSM 110093]UOA32850.1 2-keto-3-deoxy-L-rhamnonate aldolase [Sulfitobacter sp. DSM 110093]
MKTANTMAQKMRQNQTALGLGIGLPANPFTPRFSQQFGIDWAFIDLEHSLLSASEVGMMANYLSSVGVTPLVRLDKSAIPEASRYLDSGVQGIIMPHVDSAEEAATFVSHCKYPPVGKRSWGGASPQLGFPAKPTAELIGEGIRETLAIAMIESRAALRDLDRIAATPGLDGLLIGATDLSVELGVPGDMNAEVMRHAFRAVCQATNKSGIFFGLAGVASPEAIETLPDVSADFLLIGMDYRMLAAEIYTRTQRWDVFRQTHASTEKEI